MCRDPLVDVAVVDGRSFRLLRNSVRGVSDADLAESCAAPPSSSRTAGGVANQATPLPHVLHVHVDAAFHRHIIGRGGRNKSRLQQQLGVRLTFPRGGSTVVIAAPSPAAAEAAEAAVERLAAEARQSMDFTHFIAIPLTDPALRARVASVQQACFDAGVPPTAGVPASKLHITLVLLKLWNDAMVRKAASVLRSVPLPPPPPSGCELALNKTDIWDDDPSAARTVHAQPAHDDAAQAWVTRVCGALVRALKEGGVVDGGDLDAQRLDGDAGSLRLHLTLLRAPRASASPSDARQRGGRRDNAVLDVREALACAPCQRGVGCAPCSHVALFSRGHPAPDGGYVCVATRSLQRE